MEDPFYNIAFASLCQGAQVHMGITSAHALMSTEVCVLALDVHGTILHRLPFFSFQAREGEYVQTGSVALIMTRVCKKELESCKEMVRALRDPTFCLGVVTASGQ